jgi:NAD(P)-dependent dehydrogenase (short-subunit alcohol dehydrogenase family)
MESSTTGVAMTGFAGKTVLITGGASGIGRATALAMAAEGAQVVIGDLDRDGGEAIAAASNGHIDFVTLDVTSDATFAAAVDHVMNRHGRLDILFNNAGAGGTPLPIADMQMAEWDATMSLLLRSVALGIRLAVPAMIKGGGGAIVNTASVASFAAGNAPIAYSVAKAGVLHLTKVAAAELARHNIRVNAVCPGLILTGIFSTGIRRTYQNATLADEVDAYMAKVAPHSQPIAKPGLPEDVAEAVMYLAGAQSAFVTGTHILVDGGLLVGGRHSWDPAHQRPADHPIARALARDAATAAGTAE